MGTWTKTFMAGINDYIKIKVPVQNDMKNLQAFVQNVDAMEKLQDELVKAHKEYSSRVDQWKKLEAEVEKKLKEYRKQLDVYHSKGRERREKEYETGWKSMNAGLNQIEQLTSLDKKSFGKV